MSKIDEQNTAGAEHWWGIYDVSLGSTSCWRIGPTRIWAGRREKEWILHTLTGHDSEAPGYELSTPCEAPEDGAADLCRRAIFEKSSGRLSLLPALPDRAIIVKPEIPFWVPSRATVTIYIGIILWLRAQVDDSDMEMLDIPLFRISDSWFGPVAGDGELCYASATKALLQLDALPLLPQYATAAIKILNLSDEALPVAALRLPTQNLSLYADANSRLWTEAMEFIQEESGDATTLMLSTAAPDEAGRSKLLVEARIKAPKKSIVSVFSSLMRLGETDGRMAKSKGFGILES